jgi:hypothetical protein
MANILSRHLRVAFDVFALSSFGLLAGCIDSAQPLLTDGQPMLGQELRLQFYSLRDGMAQEPTMESFHWQDGRYVLISSTAKDAADEIGDFTLHEFEGADLIVQSRRPGETVEYAIARKLADGTYLIVAVDENDADAATRSKYCITDARTACRVTTREALLALARATAAKPHASGGLAVLLATP